jgi:hypothetical protein
MQKIKTSYEYNYVVRRRNDRCENNRVDRQLTKQLGRSSQERVGRSSIDDKEHQVYLRKKLQSKSGEQQDR